MQPTIGRIVHYRLSEQDAQQINRRREPWVGHSANWPKGAQGHVGNHESAGQVMPMIISRIFPDEYGPGVPGVNGQVFLDGNDQLWVTSAKEGPEPGQWMWPPRIA